MDDAQTHRLEELNTELNRETKSLGRTPMVMRTVPSCRPNADVAENAKEFAIAFVISVTTASDDPQNWIAKKGKYSIFDILRDIFPEVTIRFEMKQAHIGMPSCQLNN